MSKQTAPESTVFATNVSGRVKAPDRIPRHSLLSLPFSALLFLSFLFFLFYVFDSATIRIPSAIRNSCSCTLLRIADDSAHFLFPIFLFPRFMLPLYFSRTFDSRFCYRTQRSTTYVFLFFALFLYSFVFFSFTRFRSCIIFFPLSQWLLSILFHFFPSLNVLSCIFRFDMSLLFSRPFPFIFFSHLPLPHLSNPLFRARFLCLSLFFTHHSRPPKPLPLPRFTSLFLRSHYLL